MKTSIPTHQKNVGTFIHLATFFKYVLPLGNFIAPLVLWSAQKRNSNFIDEHGRGAINFQLSILLYIIAVVVLSIPFFVYQTLLLETPNTRLFYNGHIDHIKDIEQLGGVFITICIVAIIIIALFLIEIISVISAAVKASKGELYTYPLTIPFIKKSIITEKNEDEM